MPHVRTHDFGWRPDLADHRDYSMGHEAVVALLRKLKMRTRTRRAQRERVDWREFCGPSEEPQDLASSTALACVGLIQHFERRTSGRLLRLSGTFAHCAALRLMNNTGNAEVSVRAVLKAIVRCGVPPEKYWRDGSSLPEREPDPFTYSFQRDFRTLLYLRLDDRKMTGEQTLDRLKSFLAAGFPCVFGCPVCTCLTDDGDIPFPTAADSVLGGQAWMAVGYDDKLRIRSDKGALLVQTFRGPNWGDQGFGWLAYAYVRQRMAMDFWTLLKPSWLRSGELNLPQ